MFTINQSFEPGFTSLFKKLKKKYPNELFDIDGIGKQLDIRRFCDEFFEENVITADVSVDSNANVDDNSVISYTNEMKKPFERLNSYHSLWRGLKNKYGKSLANKIIESQLSGDFYIHDFHGLASGISYCFNYSAYDIATNGLTTVKKIKSLAPKYLFAFRHQLEQFITIASNSTLGATGIADFFIVMSGFVDKILKTGEDNHFQLIDRNLVSTLSEKQSKLISEDFEAFLKSLSKDQKELYENNIWTYVKETLISLIYSLNQPQRGNQSAFTNVSVYDDYFLKNLVKDYIFPDGSTPRISTIKKVQDIFIDAMNQELKRTAITFPITTGCISVDKNRNIRDMEFLKNISNKDLKFGFMNIYAGDVKALSSCCRLRSNMRKEYFNLFGSGSTKIGSLGVVSINMARLGFLYKNDFEGFKKRLKTLIKYCGYINDIKRDIIKKRIDSGKLPIYTHGYIKLDSQYSTVGINGLYECFKEFNLDITNNTDLKGPILDVIHMINKAVNRNEKIFKAISNVEQTPAENMAIKLAKKDRLLNIQNVYDNYSNQFIPTDKHVDVFDRIRVQGVLDEHFSGGSICHLNVDGEIEDVEIVETLTKEMIAAGGIYFARNNNIQECENGHITVGKSETCKECGGHITDNYTRVVGFLTNVKNWNKVRREQDYPNRQRYTGDDFTENSSDGVLNSD